MAVKLTHFLARLATEPREYARFLKDHEGFMKKAGLSKTHQKVLKSGNRKKIEAALRKEQKGPLYLRPCQIIGPQVLHLGAVQ
jgi:hypothetical protein